MLEHLKVPRSAHAYDLRIASMADHFARDMLSPPLQGVKENE